MRLGSSQSTRSHPARPTAKGLPRSRKPSLLALALLVLVAGSEDTDLKRLLPTFYRAGTNFVDAYFPSSGPSVTSGISLDSTTLSADPPLGRGRRDIANLTEAAAIDVPVIAFGGTNGLLTTPGELIPFASTIGSCSAPSCDGATPRVVDAALPNEALPTFGGVDGGFEVHMSIGFSHVDVLTATDGPENQVVGPLVDFLERNLE